MKDRKANSTPRPTAPSGTGPKSVARGVKSKFPVQLRTPPTLHTMKNGRPGPSGAMQSPMHAYWAVCCLLLSLLLHRSSTPLQTDSRTAAPGAYINRVID